MVENKEDIAAFVNFKAERAQPSAAPKIVISEEQPIKQIQTNQSQIEISSVNSGSKVFISPLARKLAEEKNLEIKTIQGTGPNNRILKQDILDHIQNQSTIEAKPIAVSPMQTTKTIQGNEYIDIELTNMRKTIAERLLFSKTSIPHFYVSVDVEMDKLLKYN